MDRRRAAGLLLALAACFATATAAPTASNPTALDLFDGAPDGCYYNFQHYGEGDRIMTNEPCLNCTCHNRMLMCYLRVCPFTKPIGQDCTVEKRADQCCPIVTCPDVPVDLLTSTTTSPAEYGPTGMGKLDKFGCSINGKYFSEGSKVPPTPNKPCEHCYCIRNMTTCVMQECTLHVDGCTPIYHKDVCCPVRYSCDHPEDEMPLLDDMSTTVRPTPGFILTSTTISPVTQMSQDCVYDNRIFPDGALIKTEKACDHCYCMKGDIVCVVQECGTPMENEGKNCTALPPREGVCCPDTYICEGDEPSTETYETDAGLQRLTTLIPPRRTSSEGSGYRNEPDEVPYTNAPIIEPEIEGSGDHEETKEPDMITTEKSIPELTYDTLASTEETHEFIPLTTIKPVEEVETKTEVDNKEENVNTEIVEKTTEAQQRLPSTTGFTKIFEDTVTDKTEDIGSGELPEDMSFKPHKDVSVTPVIPDNEENISMTETYEQDIVTSGPEGQEVSEPQPPITSGPFLKEDKSEKPLKPEEVIQEGNDFTTYISTVDFGVTGATSDIIKETTETPYSTELSQGSEGTTIKHLEPSYLTTLSTPISGEEEKETTKLADQTISTRVPGDSMTQQYPSTSNAAALDDDFVTTEAQEVVTEKVQETEHFKPHHVTASTPLLEEIEKETTEYTETEHPIPSGSTQETKFDILSTITSNIPVIEKDKEVTKSTIPEKYEPEYYPPGTTDIVSQQEQTTPSFDHISELPVGHTINESYKPQEYSPTTIISDLIETTTDLGIDVSEYDSNHEPGSRTTVSVLAIDEATTEPDKGLNTIPSEGVEENIPVSSEVQKPLPIEADLTDKFGTVTENIISSTMPDTLVSMIGEPSLSTESTKEKEDYSPTEDQISSKWTTEAASITEEVISTLTYDHTESTVVDLKHEIETSPVPKYTQRVEETTLAKGISDVPVYESSTLVASVSEIITEKPTTSVPEKEKETTTANQEDNEILNEPRIPGEGDCLQNGVTYSNESDVPSTNKCQSGCKCVSSIIKCDPIICSPPPEYMDNCETMYDTPNACCPTYICDHKTETIPPQSHSQMSGTEAPIVSTVDCHGNECEISKDQKPSYDEFSDNCKSGSCGGSPTDETKETPFYPHSETIPEQPTIVQTEECVGDKCVPVLCKDVNNCQVTPVQPCEGEQCGAPPTVILPSQQCAYGEDCAGASIPPNEECTGNDCTVSEVQPDDTHPTKICSEEEGCHNITKLPEDECKEDHCRRKDSSSLDQNLNKPCMTKDCKPTQTLNETDEIVSDTTELVTKSELEITTKASIHTEQAVTRVDSVTDINETILTKSPITSETTKEVSFEGSTISSIEEVPDKFTKKDAIDTEHPQDVTEPNTLQSSEGLGSKKPVDELKPDTESSIFSEESSTEPSVILSTIESNEITKPSIEIKNETTTNTLIELSTMPSKISDGLDTLIPFGHESSNKPSETYATELEGANVIFQESESTKPTINVKDDKHIDDVPQAVTEPIVTDTNEQMGETDYTKAVSEATNYDAPTKPEESTATAGLPELTYSSERTEHRDSSSQEVTTLKALEKTSIEPYTEEQKDITPYQVLEGITEKMPESINVPPKTDAQLDTESPIEIERDSNIGTENTYSHPTQTEIPENIYHEKTTTEVTKESTFELSTALYTGDQPIKESSTEPDHEASTENIFETSSETSITTLPTFQEVDRKHITSEIPDKDSTVPINIYPNEQENNISPSEKDQETTTANVVFLPTKTVDTNPDIIKLPTEDITTKISQDTELPLLYTTEYLTTSETFGESTSKTIKPIKENVSETPMVEDKTQEMSTSKSGEVSTPPTVSDSKITTPVDYVPKETSETVAHGMESKPQAEEDVEVNTIPILSDNITPSSQTIESDQKLFAASTSEATETETEKIHTESQTISSAEEILRPDLEFTKQPGETTVTEKEISQRIDTEPQEPAFAVTESDELRTTYPQIYDLTTLKSTEISQIPYDEDVKTKLPEVSLIPTEIGQEQNTENILNVSRKDSTEEISTGTEKLAKPEEVITGKPASMGSLDVTKEVESGTETSQISSASIPIQESYTEEPISKYSSPQPSVDFDSTKVYPAENTVEPVYQDSKQPEKVIDDLIQSLVTESNDMDTKPSDFEKDSQTQISLQSTKAPEYSKETIQQDIADELSTPSSLSTGTTLKEYDDSIAMSTESNKLINEDIKTESPSHIDKTESESTTQKKYLPEDNAVTLEPSKPEHEIVTSAITEQKLSTEYEHMTTIGITTEIITQETSSTEKQELIPSDKPLVDVPIEVPINFSHTTEIPDKRTESITEVDRAPDVEIQTETSEKMSTESPPLPSDIEVSTSKHYLEEQSSEDQKESSESTTLEQSTEAKVSEPTTPKLEHSHDMSIPSDEIRPTDRIIEYTTDSVFSVQTTETQPDIEKGTTGEEFVTTRKQVELYQTTPPVIDAINEIFTRPSVAMEEELTTLSNEIEQKIPTKEQTTSTSVPFVQTEKDIPASEVPKQDTTVHKEKFTTTTPYPSTIKIAEEISTLSPSAEKTVMPTDTSIVSYATTASDESMASEGPISAVPEEPATTVLDVFATSMPETPIKTEAEGLITKAPELSVTSGPEIPVTKTTETPITNAPELTETPTSQAPEAPITDTSEEIESPITRLPEELITKEPETLITKLPEAPTTSESEESIIKASESPILNAPEESITNAPEVTKASASEVPMTVAPEVPISNAPEEPITKASEIPNSNAPEEPITNAPETPISNAPEESITKAPEVQISNAPEVPITNAHEAPISNTPEEPITNAPVASISNAPEKFITKIPEELITNAPEAPASNAPEESITNAPEVPISNPPEEVITNAPQEPITKAPEESVTNVPEVPIPNAPEESITNAPEIPISNAPEEVITIAPEVPISNVPEELITKAPEVPISNVPEELITKEPEVPISNAPEELITKAPEPPLLSAPETPITNTPEAPILTAFDESITTAPESPIPAVPELPRPVSTEAQPTEEVITPEEEGSFPPSSGTSGYGQEPDYVEEDQTFGPGTCRYGGKVYVSAQQIPRDDPCDFCFCFRSDIICLQQSCPPPIHGCHEEPIQGFCCPRYECPVSMATTVNVTTTTTTTTTTLPPHFPTHSYRGSVQKRGCQIKGQTYKVGEVVRASSGPCLHCTCGGDGQMKCDPKVCTPEPMLRQMIAAAVSAKRRR